MKRDTLTGQFNFQLRWTLRERLEQAVGSAKGEKLNEALEQWLDTHHPVVGGPAPYPLAETPDPAPRVVRRRLTDRERLVCGADLQARFALMETPAPAPGMEDEPEDGLSTDSVNFQIP